MNNMKKNFKTKSALRCMADGGSVDKIYEGIGASGERSFSNNAFKAGRTAATYTPQAPNVSSGLGLQLNRKYYEAPNGAVLEGQVPQAQPSQTLRSPGVVPQAPMPQRPPQMNANVAGSAGISMPGVSPLPAQPFMQTQPYGDASGLKPLAPRPPAQPQQPMQPYANVSGLGPQQASRGASTFGYENNREKQFGARPVAAGGAYASGGPVRGPGGPTEDKIPAMLSAGEYVLPADTVQAVGKGKLDALRAATHEPVGLKGAYRNGLRRYAERGYVKPLSEEEKQLLTPERSPQYTPSATPERSPQYTPSATPERSPQYTPSVGLTPAPQELRMWASRNTPTQPAAPPVSFSSASGKGGVTSKQVMDTFAKHSPTFGGVFQEGPNASPDKPGMIEHAVRQGRKMVMAPLAAGEAAVRGVGDWLRGSGAPITEQVAKGLGINTAAQPRANEYGPPTPAPNAQTQVQTTQTQAQGTSTGDPNNWRNYIVGDGKGGYTNANGAAGGFAKSPTDMGPFNDVAARQGVMDRTAEWGQGQGQGLRSRPNHQYGFNMPSAIDSQVREANKRFDKIASELRSQSFTSGAKRARTLAGIEQARNQALGDILGYDASIKNQANQAGMNSADLRNAQELAHIQGQYGLQAEGIRGLRSGTGGQFDPKKDPERQSMQDIADYAAKFGGDPSAFFANASLFPEGPTLQKYAKYGKALDEFSKATGITNFNPLVNPGGESGQGAQDTDYTMRREHGEGIIGAALEAFSLDDSAFPYTDSAGQKRLLYKDDLPPLLLELIQESQLAKKTARPQE